jgi:hypothetical protein
MDDFTAARRAARHRDSFATRTAALALACLMCVSPHLAHAQDGQRRTTPPDIVETVVPALGLIGLVTMAYWKAYQALTGTSPAAKLSLERVQPAGVHFAT